MRRLRRIIGFLWRLGVRVALIWALIGAGIALAVTVYGQQDRAQPADVIVILGSGLSANNRPGPAMIRRVGRGAELWHAGYAPLVLCSGGYGLNRTRSEADACAELLRDLDVPSDAILVEEQSRSTEENALFTREILLERGISSALIVSDGYHLLRAGWIFESVYSPMGIDFAFSRPGDDPPLTNHLQSLAREVIALHWYALKTLLNLPVTYVPVLYHTGQFRTPI